LIITALVVVCVGLALAHFSLHQSLIPILGLQTSFAFQLEFGLCRLLLFVIVFLGSVVADDRFHARRINYHFTRGSIVCLPGWGGLMFGAAVAFLFALAVQPWVVLGLSMVSLVDVRC